MHYNGPNDSNLPDYVKSRNEHIRSKYVSVTNSSAKKYGSDKAQLMANTWLKSQLKGKKFVKRSAIKFNTVNSGFIKRDRNGDEYITFVLSTTQEHYDGAKFTEGMLKDWAKQINADPIVGDVDHKLYDKILNSNMSDDTVRNVLKGKKGIAKTLKAIYEKGKLWVRAIIDKRYSKMIKKSNGVSVEAFCDWEGSTATSGDVLGFTFNVNTNPADRNAGVVA